MKYKVIINGRTDSAPRSLSQAACQILRAYKTDPKARVVLRVYITKTSDRPATAEEQQEVLDKAADLI